MDPRRTAVLLVVLAAAVGGIVAGAELFLPEPSTAVEDPAPTTAEGATVLATGPFTGKAGHTVRGQVSLVQDADGYALRFVDYEQTPGPDVYVYLTPAADPDTTSEIRAGVKVLIDGGAGGGESTKVGTFEQRLPADVDPRAYGGVAIWCERFAVPFGAATLEPTGEG